MAFTTLVTTDELAAHLDDEAWVIVDVRFDLADPAAGRRAYEAAHIPGAVFADLDRDLAAAPAAGRGRHPLPDPEAFVDRAGSWGIDSATQVVAYDASGGAFAARLWWLLRYYGHEAVAVLDGGFPKWEAEGRPVRAGEESRAPRAFGGSPRQDLAVDAGAVEAARHDPTRPVVDSRAPDRFRGENETLDPVGGHIPGAVNRFFRENLRADGTFRPAEELRAELEGVLAGAAPDRAIVYCGSGVTACQNLLALEHAGLRGARLYPGSWSEWCSAPERPVATGAK
jgi:thiosulfate/3-mercaptopyruvate sulfurtransferase